MNTSQRVSLLSSVVLLCIPVGFAQAPQQQAVSPSVWAAPAQPQAAQANSAFQSACGNQPMCYDAPDFAVAVVDFRMSMASGYKLMDATLRFVNKTNQPLILGYLDGSAVALDDQGNRYAPYANRGLAGIGLVNGNSADPKFVLQPGGAGDARWELLWRPGAQDPIGSAFDLSLTIREVNTLVGGQHALGGEIPLRFQGLANGVVGSGAAPAAGTAGVAGVAGASPMLAGGTSGLPACGPSGNAAGAMNSIAGAANSVGGQQTANATNTATNTASNAMSQLAGLKSIFGKKNAAAPATSASGANCIPAATANAMPAAVGTSTAPAAAGQVVTTAPAAVAPGAAAAAGVAPAAAVPGAAPANAGKPAANARVTNAVATRGVVPVTPAKVTVPATANTAAPNGAAATAAAVNAVAPTAATRAGNPAAANAKPAAPPAAASAKKPVAPPPAAKKPAATTTTPANPPSK